MGFESELKLSRGVIRIRLGDTSERRISEACPTAAIADVEVGRIRYIEALRAELHFHALGDRKVLEDGQIHMSEIGPEKGIPMRGANRSQWLWLKCRDVKELGLAFVVQPWILDLIWAILASAVERRSSVVVSVLPAVTLSRVVSTTASLGNCERFSALPRSDCIHLPSRQSKALQTGVALTIRKGIVERHSEAVLNVILGDAVFDLANVRWVGITPALASTLLGETGNVAQTLTPCVVGVE